MIRVIKSARDIHGVRTADAYAKRQALKIAELRMAGERVAVHVDPTPMIAQVNQGNWLVHCPCGAGTTVFLKTREARCFGCGAVYPNVILPDDRDRLNIEHVLIARRETKRRNWIPQERLLDLAIENAEHGVKF